MGIIANAHTVFADREPRKAMSDPCLKLAKLFSIAVDFPKTGVPAEIPRNYVSKTIQISWKSQTKLRIHPSV